MSIENGLPFIFWVKVTAIWRQEVVWDFFLKKMSFILHFYIRAEFFSPARFYRSQVAGTKFFFIPREFFYEGICLFLSGN